MQEYWTHREGPMDEISLASFQTEFQLELQRYRKVLLAFKGPPPTNIDFMALCFTNFSLLSAAFDLEVSLAMPCHCIVIEEHVQVCGYGGLYA